MLDLTSLQPFLDWLAQHPNLAGLVTFIVAAAESLAIVGILVPGVVLMLGIGALIGLDAVPLWSSLLWAAMGAAVGDGASYWLGRHFDQQLRHVWPLSKHPELIPKGEQFFNRHGAISVLFGRFVGPLRPIIPAIAGIMHMPVARFYLVNILSAIVWAPVVLLPGVAMGASLHLAGDVALRFAIAVGTLLLLVWFFGWLVYRVAHLLFARQVRWLVDVLTHLTAHRYAVSVGFAGLLLVLVVAGWQLWHEPPEGKVEVFDERVWWETGGKVFAKSKVSELASVGLQWLGDLSTIQKALRHQGWYDIPQLSIKNTALWFAPTPEVATLPLPASGGTGKSIAAQLGYPVSPGKQWVLVLRSAKRVAIPGAKPLWMGDVRLMQLNAGPFDSGIPVFVDISPADLEALLQQFKAVGATVKPSTMSGESTGQWLLLR